MQPEPQPAPASTPMWMLVLGWILSVLLTLALIAIGVLKLMNTPPPEGAPDLGWKQSAFMGLGILEIGCAILYLFPRTSVLGAILLTGYFGGAISTHARLGDLFILQLMIPVFLWLGVFLRDERLRAILPWRRDPSAPPGGFFAAVGKTLLLLIVIVGVVAGIIAAQPSEFRVSRSAMIDAPPAKVFEHVNDFHKWEAWSPWEKLDPDAKKTFEGPSAGVGAIYKWSGNEKVGEGMMTLTESKPNEDIRIKLDFERPMKANHKSEFTFKGKGDKTEVTWSMSGENDFVGKAFYHFMKVDKMVGDDFSKGLASLKSIAEAK